MKTDTPRTNEVAWPETGLVEGDFARQLESELTAARAELAEWRILNGWGGTPEIINDFIKGQQTRIHHAQDLETELTAVTEQRDRLAEALKKLLTTGDNGYGTPTDKAWEMAEQAIAAVKGGSEKPVNLIHNGVGIADMYSRDEFENAMKRTN